MLIKNKIKYLFLFSFILIIVSGTKIYAEDYISPDDNNCYHIKNIEDWNSFIDKSQNGDLFESYTIILDSDIKVEGKELTTKQFAGVFDGNGHEITFSNSDITLQSTLFPFNIAGGTIKNLNVRAENCILDATKHDGSVVGSVLFSSGGARSKRGTTENVSIYGSIKIIPSPDHNMDITCTGINASYTTLSNCTIDIDYYLQEEMMNQFLGNDNNFYLRLKLYQFGQRRSSGVQYVKCYAKGSYSDFFRDISSRIENYYKEDSNADNYTVIAAFGGMPSGNNPSSQEFCLYNAECLPLYLYGGEAAQINAIKYFLDDDSMKKTTEELKKQETFVDYDFENIWGISEYINEGYPYLRALVSKDLVALVDQIVILPKEDEITKDNKEAVEKIKEALAGLSDKDKALIPFDTFTDKVTKAEEAIKAIEEKEKEDGKTQPQEPTTISVKKGTKFTVKGYKYTVTGTSIKNPTVSITGYKNKKLKKISIPATVTNQKIVFKVNAIGNNAFKGQKKATAVIVGKNIASIGKESFAGDAKVKKITVKSVVLKKVGAKAFKGIHKKAVIKVPKKQVKAYKKLMKNKGQAKTVKIK